MAAYGIIGGYNIRTSDGLSRMLEDLARGYPGYEETPFTVVLSDDRCRSLGAYVISRHEIRVFSMSDQSDLSVFEIAVHELAHHIDTCINNGKCGFHSRKFYRILFDLFARADREGIAGYGDITKMERYLGKLGKFGRPHDIQIMERYYGRPDGKPVDKELLERELKDRKEGRPKSVVEMEALEETEYRKRKDLETARKREELKKDMEVLRDVFGWS